MIALVFSNMSHRPARTAVTVTGIAIGVLLVVFTAGLSYGILRERGRREADINAEIRVSASGTIGLVGPQRLAFPASRALEFEKIPGVRGASPLGQTLDKSDTGFGSRLLDGIPFEEYSALTGLQIIEGSKLTGGDEAIISRHWQRQRKAAVGSTIMIFERPFKIVGIYDPPGGASIKIPLSTMQEQLEGHDRCTAVLVGCQDPSMQTDVAAAIHERFPDDQIIFTRDLPELYATSLPALDIFVKVVVAIAAVISTLVTLLAMYTTVMDRTRQIGILKSLGMSKSRIALVIQQEALVLGLSGFVLGIILVLGFRLALTNLTSLHIDVEPQWVLIAFLIGLIGSGLGAIYPAWKAARQDAVQALTYE